MRSGVGLAAAIVIAIGAAAAVWMLWPTENAPGSSVLAPIDGPPAGIETRPASPSTSTQQAIRPRSFVPADEDSPSPGPEDGLLVTVVDADNQPVKGAVVATCDPSAPSSRLGSPAFPTGVTRSDGSARVRVDVPPDVAHVIVLAHGHAPALVRVDDPKRQQVTLAGEAFLRGKVLVNGSPPEARLSLRLQGYSDPTDAWGEPLRGFLGRHGFGRTQIPFDTDASGEFAVHGLLRGETCVIVLPEGYRFSENGPGRSGRELIVQCNAIPVTLDLSAMNVLSGRVVAAKDAPPRTQEVEVRYGLNGFVPGSGGSGSVAAELGHPFHIYFNDATLTGVTFEIWELPYPGRRVASRRIDQKITGSKDLGDIVLDAPTKVTFVIRDPTGQPITDARVLAFGHVSSRSTADGRTILDLYPGIRAVVVGAPRFEITGMALPEKIPAAIDVTLAPACMIIVRVRNEDPGEPVRGLRVAVAYDVDAVAAAADSSPEFGDVRIGKPVRSNRLSTAGSGRVGIHGESPGHQTHWYEFTGADIVVSGFKKGDEARVRVEDRHGTVLLDEGASFADDNVNAMELVVRSRPRTIRGTVLGDRSEPLKGASVAITSQGLHSAASSDASGRFELPDVYASDPTLIVSAHGHVQKTLQGPQVFDSPTIVLDRGRRILVRLTGPSTAGMEARAVLQTEGGEPRETNRHTPDTFVFDGVPCRPGTIRIVGRTSETSVAIGAEETRVEVARPE